LFNVTLKLNYIFECDWLIELSNNKLSGNKLSDNNLASELVENRSFLKPITIEEIEIFMINIGNRTSRRPIQSGLANQTHASRSSDFVNHSNNYRPSWIPLSPITIRNRHAENQLRSRILF